MRIVVSAGVVIASLLVAPPLHAQPHQDTAELDSLVASFTGAAMGEAGGARGPVDPRLRLVRCSAVPMASWFGAGRGSVKVECPVPGGWTVYVPLVHTPAAQMVIARGDPVAIELKGRGFAMIASGEALSAGAPGASIAVRLSGQDARSRGVTVKVLGPGKVGIDLP